MYEKIKIRFISPILVLNFVFIMLLLIGENVSAESPPRLGDYIYFGRYNNDVILWKVIHIDKEGDPLLFSDKIICIKAFDAKGPNHIDGTQDCANCGSNLWSDSNIRQWLNSNDEKITSWIQDRPSRENVWYGYNPYDKEKGFLAGVNFSESERNSIKSVKHKVLLSFQYKNFKDGGTKNHKFFSGIGEIVQNYSSAYYHNVTDKVFLLDVKELHDYVYKSGWDIKAKPTQKAVSTSAYKRSDLSANNYWHYWLCSPSAYFSTDVRSVHSDGNVLYHLAYYASIGIRPALYLKLPSVVFKSGTGSYDDPYIIDGKMDTDALNELH